MALRLHNFRISTRVAMALALPLCGLFALSIWIVAGYYRTADEMERLRILAVTAPAVSALAHAVQTERGISASFIGSSGAAFADRLPMRHRDTDAKRLEFEHALENLEPARFGANLARRIALAREALDQVATLRQAVARGTITAPELTGQYANVVRELIGIVEEMRLFGTRVDLTRTISTYTNIMHAKEFAGLERAVGAAGFAAGRFDLDSHARFIKLIERQLLYLEEFWLSATPEQAALLDRVFADFDSAELERMRLMVIKSQATAKVSGVDVAHWFDISTRKIERLKTVEDGIGATLIVQVKQAEQAARQAAWWISLLATGLLLLTVALATILARSIIRPLARITHSMSKLAARDGSIEIEDGKRGDEIGDMANALVVFRDSLLKVAQAEERLKNEAILLLHHEALSGISQGVLITDAQHRITYANPAFQRISGYIEAEILGATPSFLHSRGGDTEILTELRRALTEGRHFQGHLLNYMKDGTPFWSDLSVNPVFDKVGRPTHFVGVTRDITENRLMQQELRIAATAFESLHGIMVTDAGGIILRVNKAFCEMTGYSAADVVGKTPAILKSGRHEPEFYAAMWRQLSTTGAWYGEVWDRRKNGEVFPKWQTISAVMGMDARATHYVAAFSDISESKAAEDEIRNLAFYDPLTQLPNRRLLHDRLQHALTVCMRDRCKGALLFMDLDNFKNLNDTLGHDKGDLLLEQVAMRLTQCVREGDTVARLGGDEFVLMLEDLGGNLSEAAAHAETVGEKILETLNQPYNLAGHEYHSTPSVGVTLFGGNDANIDDLLKQADLAMYQAKAAGRNTVRFFQPDMQATVSARSALESDLRKGLRDSQFLIHYQPQVDGAGRVTGAEALLRWQNPQRGMVPPAQFIPLAEETGVILPLGHWVLQTACAQLARWAVQPGRVDYILAVNVSAHQFRQTDFVEQVLAVLDSSGANPQRLKLELTESLLVHNVEEIIEKMSALKLRGVGFALDDFGTGYSSLSYLKRLPLDQLKIDRSFVRDVLADPNDAAIARTVVALANSLGLNVIAEGVETVEQRHFLAASGCHAYQGYLYGIPLAIDEFERFVERT